MVVFEFATSPSTWGMYVADHKLHRYAKTAGTAVWEELSQPGKIFDLAATNTALYALVDVDSPKLYRFDQSIEEWKIVDFTSGNGGYSRFQVIYGETGSDGEPKTANLYLGAMNSSGDYAVFHTTGSGNLSRLNDVTGLLTGAAYNGTTHYISTDGGGVYQAGTSAGTPTGSFTQITNTAGFEVKGLIRINDTTTPSATIVALCGNGDLYTVSGSSATKMGNAGVNLRGPAAVWTDKDDSSKTLLLAAIASSSSTYDTIYGYRELELSGGGLPGTVTMKEPGTEPSTVDDTRRYQDTIEPKPINAIFQAPDVVDSDRTLFASVQGRGTAKDNTDGGVWSYRSRGGVWQWNAEE
jgi:hypothetical protein